MIVIILLSLMVLALLVWYCVDAELQRSALSKAFAYTKEFGNVNLYCISVLQRDAHGTATAFYLYEEGAERDNKRKVIEVTRGWDGSAYPVKKAYKDTQRIISKMPYHISINFTNEYYENAFFGRLTTDDVDCFISLLDYENCKDVECAALRNESGNLCYIIYKEGTFSDPGALFELLFTACDVPPFDARTYGERRIKNCKDYLRMFHHLNYGDLEVQYLDVPYETVLKLKYPNSDE